jgi:hypothetical protein
MRRAFAIALVMGATAAFGQQADVWKTLYENCRQNLDAYRGLSAKNQGAKAFVLVIDTPDELITAVAVTEKAALGELYKYVRKSWKASAPIPADDEEAVDQFFSSADYDYEIREQPLVQ